MLFSLITRWIQLRAIARFSREKAIRLLIKRKFDSARARRSPYTSLLNRRMNVRWCKELHHAVLNFLSLKSRVTSVHRSQKPRTSDAVSTHRPCFSPLNLPGILHLFLASHLRITNYQRTCSISSIFVVLPAFFFSLPLPLHFLFFSFAFVL